MRGRARRKEKSRPRQRLRTRYAVKARRQKINVHRQPEAPEHVCSFAARRRMPRQPPACGSRRIKRRRHAAPSHVVGERCPARRKIVPFLLPQPTQRVPPKEQRQRGIACCLEKVLAHALPRPACHGMKRANAHRRNGGAQVVSCPGMHAERVERQQVTAGRKACLNCPPVGSMSVDIESKPRAGGERQRAMTEAAGTACHSRANKRRPPATSTYV